MGLQPATTDIYLPALPALTQALDAPMALAQLTMSGLILAFGFGQLFWGPVADRIGRRPALLASLGGFGVASLAGALAGSIESLIVWRAAQGLTMAGAVVCSRAMVRDLYEPQEGAQVMALALSGLGLVAIVGPVLGGIVAALWDWRAALLVVALYGAAALAFVIWRLPETLQVKNPHATDLAPMFATWARIARHPTFLAWTLLVAAHLWRAVHLPGRLVLRLHRRARPVARRLRPDDGDRCRCATSAATLLCRRWIRRHGMVGAVQRGAGFTLAVGDRDGRAGASTASHRPTRCLRRSACTPSATAFTCPAASRAPSRRFRATPAPRRRWPALRWRCWPSASGAGWRGAGRLGTPVPGHDRLLRGPQRGARLDPGAPPRERPGVSSASSPSGVQGLCLVGPTASGKTAVALALAARVPLEVISVDSALVYRGMDIGSAKPSPAERAAVPHHLIDILDPLEAYSAARFAADATRLAGEIRARGRLPLLVGGTMLYFKALRDGLNPMPAADPALRAQIDARAAAVGWPALHAELAQVDPVIAARLAPNDSQRIQRALEVWQLTGRRAVGLAVAARPPMRAPPGRWCRWSRPRRTAPGCTRASRRASTRCWRPASSTKCVRCAHAATCTRTCRRCAASATARPGPRSTPATCRRCASRASPPPASSPSAS